eukprot:366563-Chlamydomonas_euryale.AAC.15
MQFGSKASKAACQPQAPHRQRVWENAVWQRSQAACQPLDPHRQWEGCRQDAFFQGLPPDGQQAATLLVLVQGKRSGGAANKK